MFGRRVDERREGLNIRRWPIVDPVVISSPAKDDVVLLFDYPTAVREHLVPSVEEPVARFLGHAVDGNELVQEKISHGILTFIGETLRVSILGRCHPQEPVLGIPLSDRRDTVP